MSRLVALAVLVPALTVLAPAQSAPVRTAAPKPAPRTAELRNQLDQLRADLDRLRQSLEELRDSGAGTPALPPAHGNDHAVEVRLLRGPIKVRGLTGKPRFPLAIAGAPFRGFAVVDDAHCAPSRTAVARPRVLRTKLPGFQTMVPMPPLPPIAPAAPLPPAAPKAVKPAKTKKAEKAKKAKPEKLISV